MRILYCLTGLAPGGAEVQAVALACAMKARGHEVMLVSMLPVETPWGELERAGIIPVTMGMRRGRPSLVALFRFALKVREFSPNVIHSHMVHANIFSRCVRLIGYRGAIVSTVHSIYEGGLVRTLLYRATDWLGDVTTHVSLRGTQMFLDSRAAPKSKIIHVPNAVDLGPIPIGGRNRIRDEVGCTAGSFLWLAVGRLTEAKDYPNLLEAFRRLAAFATGDWILAVAGDGELRNELKEVTNSLGLVDRVRWLGLRRDVTQLFQAADAFVLSSAWEGLPMVLLEAAGAEKPVVATDVGGNREVVLDGRSGLLVPPKNSIALARALEAVMALPLSRRQEMGARGFEHVKRKFSYARVLPHWDEIYRDPSRALGVPYVV
jgi:glycosyltransferase involved in cell wall biosynthesis